MSDETNETGSETENALRKTKAALREVPASNPEAPSELEQRVASLELALHDLTTHVFAHSKPHEGRLRAWWEKMLQHIAPESA